jgi:hypothetical protein
MRLRHWAVLLVLAAPLSACDNFSELDGAPTPNAITVTGLWEGTARTTTCTPAGGAVVDFCAVLAAGNDFPFRLVVNQQQDDRVAGLLDYAGALPTVGGIVTGDDTVRLAGNGVLTIDGTQLIMVIRNWSTDILGRGIAGSRMSGTWITEVTVQGTTATARAEHTIVSATRTQ